MNWYKSAQLGVYGYWLTPEGKMIPVGVQEHAKYLRLNTNFFVEGDPEGTYQNALDAGWVRIISQNPLEVELAQLPNDTQKRVLNRLYRDVADSLPTGVVLSTYIDFNRRNILKPADLRGFMEALNTGKVTQVSPYAVYASGTYDKVAFPVTENKERYFYTDIGHGVDEEGLDTIDVYETKVKLWAIDKKWQLHEALASEEKGSSRIHPRLLGKELPKADNIIATGRYDPSVHTASIIYCYGEGHMMNPRRVEYITKRVAQILDRKYNSPKIVLFH